MKILELRFKNLNSLYGEWCIDFTDPAFTTDGLFAITGPTGSGKTTILDAICLALYGQTPRLGKMTQSDNEVMSRQTGECCAEVLFEAAEGTFRATWQQHRSRKKADGALQAPKREVSDAKGNLLAEKRTDVQKKIDEITGMSFDRFTRSILLAQGSFDTFLKADADARSPILEQITGTEIYSEISKAVHLRNSEENQKLKVLKAALGGIQLLSEEELEQLEFDRNKVQSEFESIDRKRNAVQQALDHIKRIAELEKELETNREAQSAWTDRYKAFEPEAEKLANAKRARPLEIQQVKLINLRNHSIQLRTEIDTEEKSLPELAAAYHASKETQSKANELLQETVAQHQKLMPVLKQVRALDTQISERSGTIEREKAEWEKQETALKSLQQNEQNNRDKLEAENARLTEAEAYLKSNAADAGLVAQFAVIVQSIKQLGHLQSEKEHAEKEAVKQTAAAREAEQTAKLLTQQLEGKKNSFSDAQKQVAHLDDQLQAVKDGIELKAWQKRLTDLQRRLELEKALSGNREQLKQKTGAATIATAQLETEREKLDGLKREQKLLMKNLQLQQKIENLEAERKQLKDGEPCPLCGALEHPFAAGLPEPEAGDLDTVIEKIESVQSGIDQLNKTRSAAEALCETLTAQLSADETEIKALPEGTADEVEQLQNKIEQIEKLTEELAAAHTVLSNSRDSLRSTELEAQSAQQTAATEQKKMQEADARTQATSASCKKADKELRVMLSPYGLTQTEDAADILAMRRDQWIESEKQKQEMTHRISTLNAALAEQGSQIRTQQQQCTDLKHGLDNKTTELETLKTDRKHIFKEQNPDVVETELQQTLDQLRSNLEAKQDRATDCREKLKRSEQKISDLKKQQQEAHEKQTVAEAAFLDELNKAAFENEEQWQSVRLGEDEMSRIERAAEELKTEQTTLTAIAADKTQQLQDERKKEFPETSPDELTELSEQCNTLQQQIGEFKNRIDADRNARNLQAEKLDEIKKQETECKRWNTLHELIGSADGKKFRNFAQGLTFELMVSHANQQLAKMSDRYLLIRDIDQPLDLNVVDNYQAGEIRPVKNLSGGESFIVSLSLALGLSKMASQKIRVDSLFLDEGFGTLDEDALETALEALAELKQDGKIIGVISHVAAMKERIGTQINLQAGSGGKSRLSGAGVSSI